MKRRIEMDECTFYQNPEARKTVAVLSGIALDVYAECVSNAEDYTNPLSIPEEYLLPNEIKAISTCHSSDNWDPEVGKKQAFYKLCRTYNKMKSRAISRVIKMRNDQLSKMQELQIQYSRDIDHYNKLVRYPRLNDQEV